MTKSRLTALTIVLTLLPAVNGSVGTASAQQTTTQTSPRSTEPLPVQGAGQVAPGAAVTGSSPGPGTSGTTTEGPPAPSKIDNSQEQQGKLLKPGKSATDMDAAAGARPKPGEQPK